MQQRLASIKARIANAARQSNRDPQTVRLVAVTKTVPVEVVRAAIPAGITVLGENYVQEAREKFNALHACGATWHFIGHLQRNKAKYAVRMFDLIHTVDSLRLARELDKEAHKIDKIQPILIQVNISQEASKSGIQTSEAIELVAAIAPLKNLAIRGLMTMPPFFDQPDKARPYFAALRRLADQIAAKGFDNVAMDELSMGMTGDFEAAIAEGATLVRIGTALFGART